MKIWTKKELYRGYISSDKVHFRGISFELYGLENFDKIHLNSKKITRMIKNFRDENKISDLIDYMKFYIKRSKKYQEIEKEGYHTHLYLNLNYEGVDCFISR